MTIIRGFNDIVVSMMEFLRLAQPALDTKPGTVTRDVFIDLPADQLAFLYSQLASVRRLQSFISSTGVALDNLSNNYGISRKLGSKASGKVVFTFNSISSDVPIPNGSAVISRNGVAFNTIGDYVVKLSQKNNYASAASRLRQQLNLAGITDKYAIEIPVEASQIGTSGNVASFSIINHNVSGLSKVINLDAFSGGQDRESDAAFRARIISSFNSNSTGTATGYRNIILTNPIVQDILIVTPGDPLLTRDGTETVEIGGVLSVKASGSGGKVDIYTQGTNTTLATESYIYNDLSGTADATQSINDKVLGQTSISTELTLDERRVKILDSGSLPYQPAS